MKTLSEILKASSDYLSQKGIQRPRRLVEELLSDVLKIQRVELYMQFDRPLIEKELEACRLGLARLAKREPWQYVCGEVEFFDCTFRVTPAVLIPRQETEILVDLIAKQLAKEDLSGKVLWDLCCGSGCIGISLKKRFPELKVILSDLSPDALKIATENAKRNEVEVELRQGDFLQVFEGERCHYFVCNPPYIAQHEFATLEPEVRDYEPRMALVSGDRGTEFYELCAKGLKDSFYLESKAWFEIGSGQGESLLALFNREGWKKCRLEKDWSGHNRFFFLENE